jgi:hypothetical protein
MKRAIDGMEGKKKGLKPADSEMMPLVDMGSFL